MLKWLLTTLVLFTISSAAQLSAQEPQIAYYTFNQTSGQTVPNLAQPGQGNNPAFLSAVPNWQSTGGHAGGALNEYVDVSGGLNGVDTGVAMPSSGDFTIEFWFRKNNATGFEVFVSNNSNSYIYMDAAGTVRWFVGPGEAVNSGTGYDDNVWHHVACTFQGSNDRARMYIDGSQVGNNNLPSRPAWGTNTVQLLHFTGLYPFTGDFDEFRWWDERRNPGQINGSMNTEQLPAQPFLYGPNLSNIPDTTTYNQTDIIDNTTRTLPFEFHNGDAGGDYSGVAVSIIAQNNATATVSTAPVATITSGSFSAFDIDLTVTIVTYTIELQIDYVLNAT
ncbi:MAG: LamG domain-containing protein, partial [Planctomycetes bacterium]|nr:LamG domain-containing protein [Planctomycetota bacterium]